MLRNRNPVASGLVCMPVNLMLGMMVATCLLVACKRAEPPEKVIRPVLSEVVQVGPHWREATYAGEVKARYETALAFRIEGKLIERYVDVGDEVLPDTPLAKLDPEDYLLLRMEAEAGLAAARAVKNKAAADLERYAKLLAKNVISKAEYQDYVNTFDVARARLRQAEAELEVTRNQAEYTSLRSDQRGVITAVEAEVGQVVAAGQTVMRLALAQEKEVVIAVAENRLDELHQADDVRISLWADPDTRYRGRVREISPGADPVTRTYKIQRALLEAGPDVQLGMTATVAVRRRLEGDLASLPLSAIYQKDGEPAVWVVEPETGTVTLQPVSVVEYQRDAVLIGAGLETGQRVVTAGVHKLMPGQKVRLTGS